MVVNTRASGLLRCRKNGCAAVAGRITDQRHTECAHVRYLRENAAQDVIRGENERDENEEDHETPDNQDSRTGEGFCEPSLEQRSVSTMRIHCENIKYGTVQSLI